VEWRIAVAAKFSSGGGGTQPVATSQALRIDTLHGPSRQILHVSPPLSSGGLQVEPTPDSDGLQQSQNPILTGSTLQEAFSVKVEPEPLERRATFSALAPWTRKETEKLREFCVC
jgi:hypothetical protein